MNLFHVLSAFRRVMDMRMCILWERQCRVLGRNRRLFHHGNGSPLVPHLLKFHDRDAFQIFFMNFSLCGPHHRFWRTSDDHGRVARATHLLPPLCCLQPFLKLTYHGTQLLDVERIDIHSFRGEAPGCLPANRLGPHPRRQQRPCPRISSTVHAVSKESSASRGCPSTGQGRCHMPHQARHRSSRRFHLMRR
jgi:hypothetical protein